MRETPHPASLPLTPEEGRFISAWIRQIAEVSDIPHRALEQTLQAEKERLRQLGEWPPKEPLFDPSIDWRAVSAQLWQTFVEPELRRGDMSSHFCKEQSGQELPDVQD